MAELATIPISFFELTIHYVRPHIRLWTDRAAIIQGIVDAIEPWNLNLDDLEVRSTGKISEQGVNFNLPIKRISFFFGAAWCRFTRNDADWDFAEETISILEAFTSTLAKFGKIVLGTRKTSLGLHVQPRTMPFMEVLRPLVPPQLAALETVPIRSMATVAKRDHRTITVDGFGSLANALFVRLDNDFIKEVTFEQIAQQLRSDQIELFKLLGLEEDRA
jgi:hypothetical protein